VEQATAVASGVEYINPIPWFCSARCTAIIGNHEVYLDDLHITATWAKYLENLLAEDLRLHPVSST
jgi:hypothetical protein